ncbi:MAG: 50S ribosomal protein L13 [Chlamydiae bacterium]|nr:50S ribosomal protein L13 [Chlamydiota bacterium]
MSKKARQPSTMLLTKEQAGSDRKWFLLDATGKTLGRFASEVAKILRGKHKTSYTPHVDGGDGVIIINAEKIAVTGSKESRKNYVCTTGFIGGYREVPYHIMKARKPTFILQHAIEGMMPANRLTRPQLKRLRIFAGEKHDMQAQVPQAVEI